jgi:hypothetical protein
VGDASIEMFPISEPEAFLRIEPNPASWDGALLFG